MLTLSTILKLPDFKIFEANLWWSERPVSNVLDSLNIFFIGEYKMDTHGIIRQKAC